MKSVLIPLPLVFVFSSCAWYRDMERSLVDDQTRNERSSLSVPKKDYDKLLRKYDELSKKYDQLQQKKSSSQLDELQSPVTSQATLSDTETVDVFSDIPVSPIKNEKSSKYSQNIESELSLYRNGMRLKSSDPDEATKVFQQLETNASSPIRARAKYQIGDILFEKGQYDLSLQVFESIIQHHSHSGVVLDALKGAMLASGKLGLKTKNDQYASMLNDVFGGD